MISCWSRLNQGGGTLVSVSRRGLKKGGAVQRAGSLIYILKDTLSHSSKGQGRKQSNAATIAAFKFSLGNFLLLLTKVAAVQNFIVNTK